MKEADAGAGGGSHACVPEPSSRRQAACTTRSILGRRAIEMAAKGAREYLRTGETHPGRYRHDLLRTCQQSGGRVFEPEAQRVLLRRFTSYSAKCAVKMER